MTPNGVRRQRQHARFLLAIAIVYAVAAHGPQWSSANDATTFPPPIQIAARPSSLVVAATWMGSAGVEAGWVRAENARPGTAGWEIGPGPAVGIVGFADHSYVADGDTIRLYVSTRAPTFRIDAFRMGFYGGIGARRVWRSGPVTGTNQPACPVSADTNMVSCANWTPSFTLTITDAFVPGDYLLKLEGNHGQQSYVPLTVWDPNSHATYVIKNDIFTWQAWNNYGGYDFYAGQGPCPPDVYPICNRARIVSFDRPYGYGNGAGDFLGNEYPLIRFAEQHNLDITYTTDLTIEQHPNSLTHHKALLSLGHDECWALHERITVEGAATHGLNVAFFAASPILRHIRLQPSPLGPERQEIDYRDAQQDPLNQHGNPLDVTANTWSSPPANWSADSFVGATYAGYLEPGAPPANFVVADATAWIYRNTGLHNGSIIPNLLASDFDQYTPTPQTQNEQILGHSPIPLHNAQSTIGTTNGAVYSDMTYRTQPPNGAGIFDTGTNNWIPTLNPCTHCPPNPVNTMTANLLWLFGQGPAAHTQPPTPNTQHFY